MLATQDLPESQENLEDSLSPSAGQNRKDIWQLVKESKKTAEKESASNTSNLETSVETTVLFAGAKGCGKSTLIAAFLDRDGPIAPSVALEYTYGRKNKASGVAKDLVHIWELAGGISLGQLIDVTFTESNIHLCSLIICVDLSKPEDALEIIKYFIDKGRTCINKILDGLESRGSKRPKGMRTQAWNRIGGPDHPDKDRISPFPIPILIVASKYDSISQMESYYYTERRKLLCKTLRFIAHINGASLVFTSSKDESSLSKFRQFMSHYSFKSSLAKSIVFEHTKPIFVVAGQDTLNQIGVPPSQMASEGVGKQQFVPLDKWELDYTKYFPRDVGNSKQPSQVKTDLTLLPEPAIDAIPPKKEAELERLRAANLRKLKERDLMGGLVSTKKGKKDKSYSRAKASQMESDI